MTPARRLLLLAVLLGSALPLPAEAQQVFPPLKWRDEGGSALTVAFTANCVGAGIACTYDSVNKYTTLTVAAGAGGVTSVTATSPIASSGGATPDISIVSNPAFTGTPTVTLGLDRNAAGTLTLGGTNANAITIGNGTLITSFPGTNGIQVAGNIDRSTAAALNVGTVNASAVNLGVSSTTVTTNGAFSVLGNTTVGNASTDTATINATVTNDIYFTKEANHIFAVLASTTAATAGGDLAVRSGAGNGAAGGSLTIDSGSGTAGGAITVGGTNGASLALGRSGIITSVLDDFSLPDAATGALITASGDQMRLFSQETDTAKPILLDQNADYTNAAAVTLRHKATTTYLQFAPTTSDAAIIGGATTYGGMLLTIVSSRATIYTLESGSGNGADFASNDNVLHDLGNTGSAWRNTRSRRYICAGGTAPVAGDFALSAGWGTTASVGTISGQDCGGSFVATSSGTGQGANPTITYTFKNGTWGTAANCIVQLNGTSTASDLTTPLTQSTTTTTLVFTFNGTPTDTRTYTMQWMCLGAGS